MDLDPKQLDRIDALLKEIDACKAQPENTIKKQFVLILNGPDIDGDTAQDLSHINHLEKYII